MATNTAVLWVKLCAWLWGPDVQHTPQPVPWAPPATEDPFPYHYYR